MPGVQFSSIDPLRISVQNIIVTFVNEINSGSVESVVTFSGTK